MNSSRHFYVAIVTARGGSKRIKNKNLRPLAGKPLIVHTLDAAHQIGRFVCVVVTSDAQDILETGKAAGARTIERPAELASDLALSEHAVRHALETLMSDPAFAHLTDFVLLQPTSPLRTAHNIAEALDQYERQHLLTLASVVRCNHPPQKTLIKNAAGEVEPLVSWEALSQPRQLLPDAYQTNGAIYISNINSFLKTESLFARPFGIYEMTDAESVDIDDEADFARAEKLLAH